jgi:molybdenum cofactor biosynthesis protein B
MSTQEHKSGAPRSFSFFVITVSDSCFAEEREDRSGPLIISALEEGNTFVGCTTVPDDKSEIEQAVLSALYAADCVITTGGTGITKRDVTIESVRPLLDKEIPGFGELFRRVSYDEVGGAAIISGAMAGIIDKRVVFCLPGSTNAVRTGVGIIRSECYHMLKHARE